MKWFVQPIDCNLEILFSMLERKIIYSVLSKAERGSFYLINLVQLKNSQLLI